MDSSIKPIAVAVHQQLPLASAKLANKLGACNAAEFFAVEVLLTRRKKHVKVFITVKHNMVTDVTKATSDSKAFGADKSDARPLEVAVFVHVGLDRVAGAEFFKVAVGSDACGVVMFREIELWSKGRSVWSINARICNSPVPRTASGRALRCRSPPHSRWQRACTTDWSWRRCCHLQQSDRSYCKRAKKPKSAAPTLAAEQPQQAHSRL